LTPDGTPSDFVPNGLLSSETPVEHCFNLGQSLPVIGERRARRVDQDITAHFGRRYLTFSEQVNAADMIGHRSFEERDPLVSHLRRHQPCVSVVGCTPSTRSAVKSYSSAICGMLRLLRGDPLPRQVVGSCFLVSAAPTDRSSNSVLVNASPHHGVDHVLFGKGPVKGLSGFFMQASFSIDCAFDPAGLPLKAFHVD